MNFSNMHFKMPSEWAKALENRDIKTILQQQAQLKTLFKPPIATEIKRLQALCISPEIEKLLKQQKVWQDQLKPLLLATNQYHNLFKTFNISSVSKDTIAIFNKLNHQPLEESLRNIRQCYELIEPVIGAELQQEVNEPTASYSLDTEVVDAVILGDEKRAIQFTPKQIISAIFAILTFLGVICSVTGYSLKDFIEPSEKALICQDYQITNIENAEIRRVRLTKGTLNVRQYPKEKGKILAELPNGELICLPHKPKGNQRWLKVQVLDENEKIISGYVEARFTEKIPFINGEPL